MHVCETSDMIRIWAFENKTKTFLGILNPKSWKVVRGKIKRNESFAIRSSVSIKTAPFYLNTKQFRCLLASAITQPSTVFRLDSDEKAE